MLYWTSCVFENGLNGCAGQSECLAWALCDITCPGFMNIKPGHVMLCFFYEKAEPTQELRDTANKRGRELCKKRKKRA